jgi:hypothetical protein
LLRNAKRTKTPYKKGQKKEEKERHIVAIWLPDARRFQLPIFVSSAAVRRSASASSAFFGAKRLG